MPANTPIRELFNPLPQMGQELGGHVLDPSLVHPSKSSLGSCPDKLAVQKPRLIGWRVPRSQAEPLSESFLGHVGGEGLPSISVLGISAPDLPHFVGQYRFDGAYALVLPVKVASLVQLYAGHLICTDILQDREREALLCNAEVVDVKSPVEALASFGSVILQTKYRPWRVGLDI